MSQPQAPRKRWTSTLHAQFVYAVELLGGRERTTPRRILDVMYVKDLTLAHVKSHLQAYRRVKCTDGSSEEKVEKEANNNEEADPDINSSNSSSVAKTQRAFWSSTKEVSMSIFTQADPQMGTTHLTKDDGEKTHLSLEFTLGPPSWGIDYAESLSDLTLLKC